MSKHRVCIDCGGKKGHINVTQSLQCNKCQTKLFDRLRAMVGKYPGDDVINARKIKYLIDDGAKIHDIASELNLSVASILRIKRSVLEHEN